MDLNDLSKDVRRLLLSHWDRKEIEDQLSLPDYFFEQVVIPHLDYLRRAGEAVPIVRLKRSPTGALKVFLNS